MIYLKKKFEQLNKNLLNTPFISTTIFQDSKPSPNTMLLDNRINGLISKILKNKEFEGKEGTSILLRTVNNNILLLGLGKSKYFERMWQKNLPSPHIHYFNKENLCRLFSKYKFQVIESGALETILIKGLYQRISWAGNLSTLTRSVIYCILIGMIPLIKFLPSDIMYVVFKKSDDSFGDGPRT